MVSNGRRKSSQSRFCDKGIGAGRVSRVAELDRSHGWQAVEVVKRAMSRVAAERIFRRYAAHRTPNRTGPRPSAEAILSRRYAANEAFSSLR